MSDKKNGATGKKSTHGPKRRTAIVEALEARTLFSADILGALLDPASNEDSFQDLVSTTADSSSLSQPSAVEQNTDTSTPVTESTVSETSVTERNLVSAAVIESAAEAFSEPLRHELVIIDSNTPNYQQIVDDILAQTDAGRHIELVMLDPARDGLAQLNELFATYSALDAVHLISHGSAGVVALGNDLVDSDALQANANQISHWSSSFNANGDFLIYGCDLAASPDGTLFIDTLSQITGADVAASDDLTGSAKLGGDWSLEYSTGAIESHLAVSIDLQDSYDAVLVNTAPVLSGANSFTAINEDNTTSSGTLVSALISGKISDIDGGQQGIAIIAVDNTNGSWQYTTDGSTWNAVGSPNQYNALLLAADANNAVRFVPNTDFNGTVTNGITYYAWDQSTGADGTTTSTIKTETLRDNFTTQTYSNSDGTKNWSAKSWTEVGDASGATGGDIQIRAGGDLQVRAESSGNYIWREADLTGALSATVTFNFDEQLTGGILLADEVVEFQVRASSADAWTSLASADKNSGSGSWGSVGNITGYISSTTQVRFVVTGTYSLGTGELYIDNFQIDYEMPGTGSTTAFSTASASSGITVNPVNDAPVNTVPAAQSLNEDVSTAISGISVNDVDGNLSSAQLSISNGALTVSLSDGATISAGANSSSTLTLSGTQTQINAALGTLTYLGNSNFYGSDTLTLLSTDSSSATDSDTMAITVNNVNDPITITSSATATAAENQNVAYTTTVFNPDPDTVTYSIDNSGNAGLREDNAKVSINASSGVVTFLSTPNFESPTDTNPDNVYHIKIKVNDNNGNTDFKFLSIMITNVNDAPTGGVFVGGTATENQVLSASNTLADQDGLGAISYQWQRNGVNIGGATASTYTLGDADVASQVKVVASYTDGGGFATSVSSTSVGPVANVNDAPVGVPTITGTVTEDQTLTANTSGISDADGLGAFSYQWLRNGAVISGATATTYVLGDVDVGTNFSVRVTYTDAHGTAEGPLTSAATAAVANVNDVPVGLPVITGTLKDGQVLTADTSGISDADGLGAFTYQWKSAGVNVGANSSTYTLLGTDIGNTMTVDITYTDGHGTSESLTSVATGAVSGSNAAPTGAVSIDNLVPNEGDILSASNTLADADGPASLTVSYQWYRNGSVITGATGSTYTTVQADVGKTITVVGSYVDGLSVNEAVTSAATAAVINTNDAPIGLPTIDGASTENQTLTANTSGISDEDGLGAFTYQWLRNGVAIPGAAASTYVLGNADVGANISVRVTYTDGYSNVETLTSAPTAAVINVNDAPVGLPSIDGVVTEDQILTANTTAITDADGLGAFTYQWFRNGASITGATASTYTLGDADVGTQISLQVSYTDSHGTSEGPLTSAPTAAVVNINDTPTLITLSNSVVDENTDTSAGYSVGGLTTTDADVGDAATYTINGGADAAFFTIGGAGSNELILTNGMLDFETKPSYAVTVRVTDAGGLFHDEVFTVNVVNVNEAPLNTVPVAQTVAEDTALNISGISVNDVDGNLATVQLSVGNGTLTVALSGAASISSGSNGSSTLTLSGSQTDINTTLASLSYQGNLNFNGADTLTVLSTDSGGVPLSDSDPVAITVTVVNDVPVNIVPTAQTVAEDTALNISGISVNDVDGNLSTVQLSVANGTLTVTLSGAASISSGSNGSSTLTLSGSQADINTTLVSLSYQGNLNYNGADTLTVLSTDSNSATKSDTVAITVTAVNDVPVGVNDTTALNTSEDTATGTLNTTLLANDTDVDGDTLSITAINGTALTGGVQSIAVTNGTVNIDAANNISFTPAANYNGAVSFSYTISDGALTSTATVSGTVTAVNDAPMFTSATTASAAENQTAVLTVSSTDVDGGTPIYSINGGADSTLFSINSSSGVLSFNAAPNFELPSDAGANNVYDVVVQADDGNGGLTTQSIAVTVTNVNEVPVFTSSATVNAAENQAAVLTVTTSDVDGGAPIYSINGGADSTLFSINSSSGVLSFNAAPNFELPSDAGANNVYDVVVQVSDGNGGLTTQAIAVTVTNVNEAPVFTSATTVNAAENQTAVLTVTSSDVDAGDTSTFSLVGGADQGLFSITAGGVLTFATAPNFEVFADANSDGVYEVQVQASDGNGGLTTQAIAVTVTNVNEAPVFTSATTANAAENQTAVLTVTSSDVDGAAPIYTISGGADSTLFSINSSSGVLSFNAAPNFELPSDAGANNVYDVVVQVSDGNGGLTTQAIAVTVTNVNEAPVFTSAATVNAAENQSAVLTVTTSDVDGGTPIYSINGGADSTLFSINSSSGVLSFNAAPNFEIPSDSGADNVYDVVVQVSDGNGGLTTQAIAVTVTNVNEAPLNTVPAAQTVAEDSALNISGISVNDVDGNLSTVQLSVTQGTLNVTLSGAASISSGSNGSSTLTLSGSQTDINATLTSLSYQGNLNYNGADTLTVLSTDSGGVPLSDSDPVAITVTAVNDAPVGLPVISGTVTENQTLTADLSGISDVDGLGVFSYQWLRNGVAIAGATSNTYTLGDADVNTAISVRVNYTDAYGTAEGPLTSAATAAVLNVNDVPVFGGSNSGVVIKNVLSNGTTLLESIGRLSIVDLDVGEASFQASTVNGAYGQLTITAAGDWIYLADNSQSAIQQLTELQTLTDTLSVTAFDGTTHTVTITIQGSVLVPAVTTTPILATPDAVNAAISNSVIDKNVLALGVSARQNDEEELIALLYANRINTAPGAMINDEVLLAPSGEFVLGDDAETATMSGASMKNNLAESKFIQLNKMDISWFKSNESVDTVSMSSIVNNHEFVNELYQLHRDLDDAFDEEQGRENLSAEVSVGVSISLTAGIVSWLLRGGSLLASFMSVAPLWKQLDPLPILGADAIKKRDEKNSSDTPNNEDDEKDKQIEDIFDEDKV